MSQLFKTVIILRNDTSANWLTNSAAILMRGEVGLEFLDSGSVKMKIGDGLRAWADLPYFGGESGSVDEAVAELEAQVGKLNTDILALMTRTTAVEEKLADVYTKAEVDSLLSTIYRVKGSVDSVVDLPKDPQIGDVYNIIYADFDNGINAGDNVVWNGESWDRLGGTVDLTAYTTKKEFEALSASAKRVSYEILTLPEGVLVDYDREKEIRVFCPENTQWVQQSVGASGNANMYYMQFRAYAPEGAVSFKEGDKGIIIDEMYTFDDDFAGIDQYGRKYSVRWLALASLNDGVWTYFGKDSRADKYIGWTYVVEWYDENGVIIGSDSIRINLSNEDCHFTNAVNINRLVQTEGDELILHGGSSIINK